MISTVILVYLFAVPGEGLSLQPGYRFHLSAQDLYRARVLAAASDGSVAVLDRDDPRFLIVSPDGQTAERAGGAGQGPGEMTSPFEIGWDDERQAFGIIDGATSRLSFWNVSGEFVGEFHLPAAVFEPNFTSDGRMFGVRSPFGINGGTATLTTLKFDDPTFSSLFEREPDPNRGFTNAGTKDHPINVAMRWDPHLTYGLGSNFLATAWGADSQVVLLDLNGKRKRSFLVNMERPEITDAQKEEVIGYMPANFHGPMRQNLICPDHWQPIRAVLVDDSDRIFVVGPASDVGKPYQLQAFSSTGEMMGKTMVPELPLEVRGGAVYFLEQGEEHLHLIKLKLNFSKS